ncbi:MAG: TetR/AcrR family transcriptional regulator C-terminal domain-containing protein, partial [Rhodoferax sp.]|uniref:TetR/AcrR family transcriptional regulator C-terminal domain-containing protein n=1 Tax=Rhodoferax sp. TaxID=50421 RepID=UPI00326653BB
WQRAQGLLTVAYQPQKPLRAQLLECLEQKMRLLNDSSFVDLSRVAIAEMMQSPQRAQAMVARLAEKEEGLVTWIRAAQGDQRLRAGVDPQYAADQLQGMVKSFAFWPQLALGQPPLEDAQQQRVLSDCVDMFLGFYATPQKA